MFLNLLCLTHVVEIMKDLVKFNSSFFNFLCFKTWFGLYRLKDVKSYKAQVLTYFVDILDYTIRTSMKFFQIIKSKVCQTVNQSKIIFITHFPRISLYTLSAM